MNPKVTSAGGLVVRPCISGWETILVGNSDPTMWRIPKGMANEGETLEETAIREVLEETGVRGGILGFIGIAGWTYAYEGKDWDETVYFFLMKFAEGNTESHDSEFEKVEWLKIEDASKALYYKNEAEIAEKAATLLQILPSDYAESRAGGETQEILIVPEIINIEDLILLGSGLSLGEKVATGRAVTNASSLNEFVQKGDPVIFVSNEMVPRDASLFTRSQGLLAVKGGITSHMAVVMRGFGKACVSGIQEMSLIPGSKGFKLRDRIINEGEWLTIDERSGGIYFGKGQLRTRRISEEMMEIIRWADNTRSVRVLVNADDRDQVKTGLMEGADGVGLVRSEHQILAEEVLQAFLCVLLLQSGPEKSRCIETVAKALEEQLVDMLKVLQGKPLHYRLLDAPINEFIPSEGETLASLAELVGMDEDQVRTRLSSLRETNSLFGCRGSRWGILHKEFYKRQIDLALSAGMRVASDGITVALTIIVPMLSAEEELKYWSLIFQQKLADNAYPPSYPFTVRLGAMVETPRAALISAQLAKYVDMLCIGTNDLTQATWAMSRDDVSTFYSKLLDARIVDYDPFRTLDRIGVGRLIEKAITEARSVNPDTQFYICGEHASDPESVNYLIGLGVNGVSCMADRVSRIKVAAARAELAQVPDTSALRHLPTESNVGKRSPDVFERIVAEVHDSNHEAAQRIALSWAHEITQQLGLEPPTVWKYFKRNLVEKWFGAGEHKRFEPGWDTEEAIAYATSHPGRKVRYSLFPSDIACHAISKPMPENANEKEWRAELEALDHSIAMEIFPQQPEDNLCFRVVFQGDEFRFEAGIGQAMYVFEQERGDHPFVQGFWDISSKIPKVTGRHKDPQQTTQIEDGLLRLLSLYGETLLLKCRDICHRLGVRWIAIEGYYNLHNQGAPFICDMDLPQDIAFHG
jgi:phosphoenolpyruvate-protein kinase (PTS system EI component)/8-oxo-dGTP pyrophosphatase MutT (NUDIX family)